MHLNLHIWRQSSPAEPGKLVAYEVQDISPDLSVLEVLDKLNRDLARRGQIPVAFESDCREGICGSCGFMINGEAHGPDSGAAVCQVRMRSFHDGQSLVLEPWRAAAFPILRDLVVDRSALDRIWQARGYISVNTGSAPEANSVLVPPQAAEQSLDAGSCIGCGACVAACPNASAMLYTAARACQLALLPQGSLEAKQRFAAMVDQHDAEGFGHCTNTYDCQAACPKDISTDFIAMLNRSQLRR